MKRKTTAIVAIFVLLVLAALLVAAGFHPYGKSSVVHRDWVEAPEVPFLWNQSDVVVRGTVEEVGESRWSTESGERPWSLDPLESHLIYRSVEVNVSETFKGNASGTIRVLAEGGSRDGYTLLFNDMSSFTEGEEVVLFLGRSEPGSYMGTYRVTQSGYRVVTGSNGKYRLRGGVAKSSYGEYRRNELLAALRGMGDGDGQENDRAGEEMTGWRPPYLVEVQNVTTFEYVVETNPVPPISTEENVSCVRLEDLPPGVMAAFAEAIAEGRYLTNVLPAGLEGVVRDFGCVRFSVDRYRPYLFENDLENSSLTMDVTVENGSLTNGSPAALRFSLINTGDENVTVSSGPPGPFGVLTARTGNHSVTLWSDRYRDSNHIGFFDGGMAVTSIALLTTLEPGEVVSRTYEFPPMEGNTSFDRANFTTGTYTVTESFEVWSRGGTRRSEHPQIKTGMYPWRVEFKVESVSPTGDNLSSLTEAEVADLAMQNASLREKYGDWNLSVRGKRLALRGGEQVLEARSYTHRGNWSTVNRLRFTLNADGEVVEYSMYPWVKTELPAEMPEEEFERLKETALENASLKDKLEDREWNVTQSFQLENPFTGEVVGRHIYFDVVDADFAYDVSFEDGGVESISRVGGN